MLTVLLQSRKISIVLGSGTNGLTHHLGGHLEAEGEAGEAEAEADAHEDEVKVEELQRIKRLGLLRRDGICQQSWALEVFLNFFTNKK